MKSCNECPYANIKIEKNYSPSGCFYWVVYRCFLMNTKFIDKHSMYDRNYCENQVRQKTPLCINDHSFYHNKGILI